MLHWLPAATWITPVSPVTWTGVRLRADVPLPSSPAVLSPQAHTVPSERNARLWLQPAATCAPTGCGLAEVIVLPVPSCPLPLEPQAHTLPSEVTARLSELPAEICWTLV